MFFVCNVIQVIQLKQIDLGMLYQTSAIRKYSD